MTEPRRRQDGSIDFDFYRAEAPRERREVRDQVIWEVVLPLLWSAPTRLLARAKSVRLYWSSGLGGRMPKPRWSGLAGPL